MTRCSSSLVANPAKDGTGTSAVSWFVGRVNGGFMITRSKLSFGASTASAPPLDAPPWSSTTPVSKSGSACSFPSSSSEPMSCWPPPSSASP